MGLNPEQFRRPPFLTSDNGTDKGGVSRAVHQGQLEQPRLGAQVRRQLGAKAREAQVQGDAPSSALRGPVESGGGADGAESPGQGGLAAVDMAQDSHVDIQSARAAGGSRSRSRTGHRYLSLLPSLPNWSVSHQHPRGNTAHVKAVPAKRQAQWKKALSRSQQWEHGKPEDVPGFVKSIFGFRIKLSYALSIKFL